MCLSRAQVATWLLTCVLPRQDVNAIIGDLEEEYASRSRASSDAHRWYWMQIMRSMPAFVWLPIRRDGWLSTFGIALATCAMQAGVEVTTGLAVRRLSPPDAVGSVVLALVVTLPSLMFLSYLATRIRPGAATAVPAVAAVAIFVQLLLTTSAGRDLPLGVQVASLFVGPSIAFMGGVLSLKTRRR